MTVVLCFLSIDIVEYHDRATGFKISVTNRLLKMLSLSERQISGGDNDDIEDRVKWGYFSILPVSVHNIVCVAKYEYCAKVYTG